MPGTILENLSGRKLSVLVTVLLIVQVACFLVGGLIAPAPASTLAIISTVCKDPEPDNLDLNRWITPQDCEKVQLHDTMSFLDNKLDVSAKNLVFVMQMPLGMPARDFSRWQQNLVGVLQIDLEHTKKVKIDSTLELTLNARLAYKNKGDKYWNYYNHAEEKRQMYCAIEEAVEIPEGDPYSCTTVPLFELGSLHHDYYLLNLRLPADNKRNNFSWISDVHLHIIHMNGGFTMVWLTLKACFFPFIVAIMFWFWNRVHILARTPALLEYMLISLGGTLAFLDLPIEFLTLFFEMPYMLLLSDIRQGIFYAMLLSFWLIFAGEHMLITHGDKNSLKVYWKHLSAIVIGCMSLLIFDLCERGVQLRNPFYSIWVTPIGTNLALSFIILAGISACIYFFFLCYMIWRVFKNISIKRSALPTMSSARRLHYEGIIYRFNFLMIATLLCAAVTIISFILSQVNEGQHKWDDNMEHIELSSALFTGVYGMWNVYICAMLILYAPSHKQWPTENICGEDNEEVEFSRMPSDTSPNEISSLTSFASKSAID